MDYCSTSKFSKIRVAQDYIGYVAETRRMYKSSCMCCVVCPGVYDASKKCILRFVLKVLTKFIFLF